MKQEFMTLIIFFRWIVAVKRCVDQVQNVKQQQRKPRVHEQEIKQNVAQQQEKLLEQEEQIEWYLSREALPRNSKNLNLSFFF